MSEERRSYRTATAPKVEAEPKQEEKVVERNPGTSERVSKYVNISGLFRSKSGKADTVRVSAEIAEKLHQIQEGDTIGVSLNQRTDRLGIWYIPNDEQKEPF